MTEPEGPGLDDTFRRTFTSRFVQAGDVRLHAVTGGDGPPLLLLCGWPQTWYAWRDVMTSLARDFTLVVPDPRGVGRSDKPHGGYDTGTLAADMVALMAALGHDRFSMAGHDVGMWTGYALAADHPSRVDRLALLEATIPGLSPSPPLFLPAHLVHRLGHFVVNRFDGINEQLVAGREDIYFGHQFATKAAVPLPEEAVDLYVDTLRDPDALRSSFAFYTALDETIAQNTRRRETPLSTPTLVITGEHSLGEGPADSLRPVVSDLTSLVIPGCGHYPAEEAPEESTAALKSFFTTR